MIVAALMLQASLLNENSYIVNIHLNLINLKLIKKWLNIAPN